MRFANFVRVTKLFFMLMLFVHWTGCLYFLFSDNFADPDESLWDSYINSLYNGVLIVVGNDIGPESN